MIPSVDQSPSDAKLALVGGRDHSCFDDQSVSIPAVDQPGIDANTARVSDRDVDDAILLVHADFLDDVEALRIAQENRVRSLTQTWEVDDVIYGKGLGSHLPEVQAAVAQLEDFKALEKRAVKQLESAMKRHYLADFVLRTKGMGLKTTARLLGCIGDPASRPNPAKLWAYCGYHTVDGVRPRRRRGEKANWNSQAKSRAYVIAEGMVKNTNSAYRHVYDARKADTTDRRHIQQCQNSKRPPLRPNGCGTQEHPEWGAPDSPWRDGHRHQDAMSYVAKRILLDLWKEARQ